MATSTLFPILVVSEDRSGSSFLMELLARDKSCLFDKVHGYDVRFLTYISKLAGLWERQGLPGQDYAPMYTYWMSPFLDLPPWGMGGQRIDQLAGFPSASELLSHLWKLLTRSFSAQRNGCKFYAENVPYWVPSMIRQNTRC